MKRMSLFGLAAILSVHAWNSARAELDQSPEPTDAPALPTSPVLRNLTLVVAPDGRIGNDHVIPVTGERGARQHRPRVDISLSGANQAPEAVPDVYTVPKDTPLVVSAPGHLHNDFDPDGDPVSWLSFSSPPNGSLTGTTTDGAFTYTPDPGFSGLEEIDYTITDGNGGIDTSKMLVLVLDDQNRAPMAVPDVFTTPRNTPLVVMPPGHLINDFDRDGDTISWVSYTTPSNGSVSGTTTGGGFTYTPDTGFSGLEEFEYTITDGNGAFATSRLLVRVLPPPGGTLPVAVPDVFTMPQDEPLVVEAPGHLANDFDPDGDSISWVSFSTPSNGSMSGTATDGAFTFTPDPGFSGLEAINYTISDGNSGTDTSKMLMRVLDEQNRAPIAVPDVFMVRKDTSLQVTAPGHLLNDIDRDGDPISWISFVSPSNGMVSGVTAGGSFTYTPNPGFSGLDEFNYTITDGNGGVSTSKLLIRVLENLPDPVFSDRFEGE